MAVVELSFHGWLLFGLIAITLVFYANDKIPMELTAIGTLVALLLLFHFVPLYGEDGYDAVKGGAQHVPIISAADLLSGFANPALITVLSLLIIGQGLTKSGILGLASRYVVRFSQGRLWLAMLISFVSVLSISAFLNNIPVVIIFIPIMQTLAVQAKI